jgi:tyrosyl-tRNA synthetase
MIQDYFVLATDVSAADLAEVKTELDGKTVNPRDLKRRLARELVRMYHSAESALAAEAEFDRVFVKKDMPDNLPEVALTLAEGSIGIVRLLTEAGFAASNSDARRLITQGGVSVDGQRITDPHAEVSLEKSVVLKVGKLRFARVSRV